MFVEMVSDCTPEVIIKAAQALKDGHLVAFPTETVYGLGADARNEKAVNRIYSVKGRPRNHPLIVHIASVDQISNWGVEIPEFAMKLARSFWPGPMTLIFKRGEFAKDFITGGQDNVGLRVPSHPIALALIEEFDSIGGSGIAAPSANRFGAVSPTSADDVKEDLRDYLAYSDLILDDGPSSIGVESTIVDCTKHEPIILRPGAVTVEMIQSCIFQVISPYVEKNEVWAAGSFTSHYSPSAKVVLGKLAQAGDGFLAMSHIPTPKGAIRLASPTNIEQYAQILYGTFRSGDRQSLRRIVVVPPEGAGLAVAIRDRLKKAAG